MNGNVLVQYIKLYIIELIINPTLRTFLFLNKNLLNPSQITKALWEK